MRQWKACVSSASSHPCHRTFSEFWTGAIDRSGQPQSVNACGYLNHGLSVYLVNFFLHFTPGYQRERNYHKLFSYFISYAEYLNLIMASATSNTAAPLSQNVGKAQEVTWETVKPDAIELYERMTLADMIIVIEMTWGFKRRYYCM